MLQKAPTATQSRVADQQQLPLSASSLNCTSGSNQQLLFASSGYVFQSVFQIHSFIHSFLTTSYSTSTANIESPVNQTPNIIVFGLWEESVVPMQTQGESANLL